MAKIIGVTYAKTLELIQASINNITLQSSGQLLFTRQNGNTFVASENLVADIATALQPKTFALGALSGIVSLSTYTPREISDAIFTMSTSGNIVFNSNVFPVSPAGTQFTVFITQGSTPRTVSFVNVKLSYSSLVLTPTAAAVDAISFYYSGSSWYAGMIGANFS